MEEIEEEIDEIKLGGKSGFISNNWEKYLERNKYPLGLGLLGLVIIISGLYLYFRSYTPEKTQIEIIPAQEESSSTIWVEIAGAVEKPGVYELTVENRVNDLLIKAGGLAAEADRQWLEKNINLAQKLSDGIKVYIPRQAEIARSAGSTESVLSGSHNLLNKLNINTATASELDQLWGIGEKRAAEIVANRPYQSIEELKSKKIIPENVFEKIKEQISVF